MDVSDVATLYNSLANRHCIIAWPTYNLTKKLYSVHGKIDAHIVCIAYRHVTLFHPERFSLEVTHEVYPNEQANLLKARSHQLYYKRTVTKYQSQLSVTYLDT